MSREGYFPLHLGATTQVSIPVAIMRFGDKGLKVEAGNSEVSN